MRKYKVFLSCSFDPEDRPVVGVVEELCRAVGFEVLPTDRASVHSVPDKVKAALGEADLVVALLTRGSKLETTPPTWLPRSWLIAELGMAFEARKPVAVLKESGVRAENLVGTAYTYLEFDRRAIQGQLDEAAVEFITSLVSFLVETKEAFPRELPEGEPRHSVYCLDEDDLTFEILPSGALLSEEHMLIRSRVPELARISQRKIITSSSRLGYKGSELRLERSLAKRRKTQVTLEVRRLEDREVQYDIVFSPPLGRNDTIDVTIVHTCSGSLPLVLEDAEDLIETDDYIFDEPIARQGKAVKVPTSRLSMEVRFPPGYRPSNSRFEAVLRDRMGRGVDSESECDRVRRDGEWRELYNRLRLEVPRPKLEQAYYISWTPPRDAQTDVPSALRSAPDADSQV